MINKILAYQVATGPKKWILWLTISISVLLAIAAIYWAIKRREKQIAKLRTEAELAAQQAEQVRYNMIRENDKNRLLELAAEANEMQHLADTKRQEIAKNEKDLAAELKQVEALKSWNDLDKYNRQGR